MATLRTSFARKGANGLRRAIPVLLSIAAFLGLSTYAPATHACSCQDDATVLPDNLVAGVPTNTRIWVFNGNSYWCPNPRLSDGQVNLETTRTQVHSELTVLTPKNPLLLGATYSVICDVSSGSTFTVTRDADSTAPPIPRVRPLERVTEGASSCGDSEYVPVEIEEASDVVLLDIAQASTFEPDTLSGNAVAVFMGHGENRFVFVGDAPCTGSNWNFDNGDAYGVRWANLDLAGNFSGWSEPSTIPAAGCSCEVGVGVPRSAPWAPIGAALLACMLVARRRQAAR